MMCGSVFAYPNNYYEYDFTGNRAYLNPFIDNENNISSEYRGYYAHKLTHNSLHPTKSNQTHAFVLWNYDSDYATNLGLIYEDGFTLAQTNTIANLVEPFIDPDRSRNFWDALNPFVRYDSVYFYCDPASTNEFSHWTLNNQVISTSPAIRINFTGPITHNYGEYNFVSDHYDGGGTVSVDYNYTDGLLTSYNRRYRAFTYYPEYDMGMYNTYEETVPLAFSEIEIKAHYTISGPVYRFLDVSTNGNGSVNITSDSYPAGTNLNLSVTSNDGWLFTGWSGDISGDYTESNKVITLNEDMNITANFSDDVDDDGIKNNIENNYGMNPRYAESMIEAFSIISNNTSTMITTNDALSMIKDLRIGSQTFDVSNGTATIRMYVDESSDLTSSWTNTQHVLEVNIPADQDTMFYRFRMD